MPATDDAVNSYLAFLSVYVIVLAVVGTIGNIFSFFVCLRKELRKVPTFVFLAFTMLADSLCLYFWNINTYMIRFKGYSIAYIDIESCRITTFLQGISLQSSAYLLVMTTQYPIFVFWFSFVLKS
jgi:hypothetical protein